MSQYFWPESFRINDLATGLNELGHEVTVLTGVPNYPGGKLFEGYSLFHPREQYGDVGVIRVPLITRGKGQGWRLALNYLSFAVSSCLHALLLMDKEYDVVFVAQYSPVTVGLPGVVLKKRKRVPMLLWIQDLWPESLSATGAVRSPFVLRLVGSLVKYIYKNCDRILVQSRGFSPDVENRGVSPEMIDYFPNWAEDVYKPVPAVGAKITTGALPDGFKVMFAGNVGAAQDFDTIIAAALRLKDYQDIHWIILGDGRLLNWVKDEIERCGLSSNFHLLGRHPVEHMPQFFRQADVMLVTLKDERIFSLTIPSKVQSYLACGRPIVAALKGEGARVIQEAGAGEVCSPGDSVGLADAVLKLYHSKPGERELMGISGRQYYEANFERNLLLAQLDKMMIDLIANKK